MLITEWTVAAIGISAWAVAIWCAYYKTNEMLAMVGM